eukprot:Protomagalhaensia_wolfi_Nauph_80__3378@NODE_3432_length_802_cov_26_665793_g2695_i0_p1_GENE_NODE_3432_length_802_cov_26_665793_g2695_i0NODE_3432_length_802_cov_26_665793_g2695_i0_p1_ORF_typecomplete_len120_score13_79_NODE_3432_length_802_cov_26_665793_g2695_i0392751
MDNSQEHLHLIDPGVGETKSRGFWSRRHWRSGRPSSRDGSPEGGDWLDLDVVDTTFMDTNVHGLRHSFWSLNREIIEDFRELLVTRKRASQRTGRLDRRDGNVWVFRVAPSFLTSIFDA